MEYLESTLPFLPWDEMYWGNAFSEYVWAVLFFALLVVAFGLAQRLVLSRLKVWAQKTATDIDDAVIRIAETLKPPFYMFIAFYFAIRTLEISGLAAKVTDAILIIWITYQVVAAVQILIDYLLEKKIVSGGDKNRKSAIRMLSNIGKGVLWALGVLIVLSNLGVDVTSLIAGLGIGGVAVAFALQNVLEDLFSSFTIYFDRPFEAGDFIVVGSTMGTVQHIGVKSTRIKSLQGEEIVVSNKELTNATIQNFKKMEKRRVVFTFGVTYETDTAKMKRIPSMIADIFSSIENVDLDRAHFSSFDDSSLSYEVVYHVLDGDYNLYMDIQQEVNYRLKDVFEKEGISMAYPTRTVYVKQ